MQPGDPRADPGIVDLIELAGLWLAAEDWPAFGRTLDRLVSELERRFPSEQEFRARFQALERAGQRAERNELSTAELRRAYRRATLG